MTPYDLRNFKWEFFFFFCFIKMCTFLLYLLFSLLNIKLYVAVVVQWLAMLPDSTKVLGLNLADFL